MDKKEQLERELEVIQLAQGKKGLQIIFVLDSPNKDVISNVLSINNGCYAVPPINSIVALQNIKYNVVDTIYQFMKDESFDKPEDDSQHVWVFLQPI